MIVSINQPAYLPWLGYFDRIVRSDLHIVLDHVQFEKNSMVNRNRIRCKSGWAWLTVPLRTKGAFGHLELSRIRIAEDGQWRQKHLKSLLMNYGKAEHFSSVYPGVEKVLLESGDVFSNLAKLLTEMLCGVLGIRTPILYSSDLNPERKKSELVLELCAKVGATKYLSGPFGRNYLSADAFGAAGLEVLFHDYNHPEYGQIYSGFEPFMSVVDLIFNHGPKSLDILQDTKPLSKEWK